MGFGPRFAALFTLAPIAVEPVQEVSTSAQTPTIRILRWNYSRIFAYLWAGLSLVLAMRNAPRRGGPSTFDMFFLMAGMLYIMFAALNMINRGYWRSFFVVTQVPGLPIKRIGLLVMSAAGGFFQFALGALITGAVFGVAALYR